MIIYIIFQKKVNENGRNFLLLSLQTLRLSLKMSPLICHTTIKTTLEYLTRREQKKIYMQTKRTTCTKRSNFHMPFNSIENSAPNVLKQNLFNGI